MQKTKSWSDTKDEKPLLHHINDTSHKNMTVYGAIGSCLTESVFKLGSSTNRVEYG